MDQLKAIENFGYSKNGAKLIIKKLNYYHMSVDTFIREYNNFKEKIISCGYSDKNVRNILIKNPRIVTIGDKFKSRFDNIKKFLSGNLNDDDIIATALTFLPETINDKINNIKSYGFKDNDIKEMIEKDPKIFTRTKNSFDVLFKFFLKIGMSNNKIIKLMVRSSKELFVNFYSFNNILNELYGYGFTKEEIVKLIDNMPSVITNSKNTNIKGVFKLFINYGLEDEEIRKKIINHMKIIKYDESGYNNIAKYMKEKNFTDAQIKKITIEASEIITYSNNKVSFLYDTLYKYGFNDENIRYIITKNPKVLYHKQEKIKNLLNKIKEYVDSNENLIKIVVGYPNIFETNVETLNEKLRVIRNFDLIEGIYFNPKNLIQGAEKTYLRYLYMFNILELEPICVNDILVLFRNKPIVKKQDEKTGQIRSYVIPDIDELRKEFTYYKDEEDLSEKFKGRKCLH